MTFVVIAEFNVIPGKLDTFIEAAADDARHSLADEPGCRQFDVVTVAEDPDAPDGARTSVASDGARTDVLFYEVYDDRAAFDAHLATPHLARFRAAFPPLVEEALPVRLMTRRHP